MTDWIKQRGINGEQGFYNMKTGLFRTSLPTEGTITRNTVNSTGISNNRNRALTAATKQASSYNNRLYKVHNYADTRLRLTLKHQTVTVDSKGNPSIVLNNYTPTTEAPMLIVSPEFDLLTLGGTKGVSLASKGLNKAAASASSTIKAGTNFVKSGRLSGLSSEIKYGLLDRLQGLRLQRNLAETVDGTARRAYQPFTNSKAVDLASYLVNKRNLGQPLTEQESKFLGGTTEGARKGMYSDHWVYDANKGELTPEWESSNDILTDISTNDRTFMQNTSYFRNSDIASNRQFRMGFTPAKRGTNLPRYMGAADREAIANTPRGSFISADAHNVTLPEAIEAAGTGKPWPSKMYDKAKTLLKNNQNIDSYINNKFDSGFSTSRTNPWDMSASAHRFFTKEGQKTGNEVVYAGKSGRFNSYGTGPNKVIYDALSAYEAGDISAKDFVNKFNKWADEFGGRHGHVDFRTGKPVFYHPTIFKKKFGGIL